MHCKNFNTKLMNKRCNTVLRIVFGMPVHPTVLEVFWQWQRHSTVACRHQVSLLVTPQRLIGIGPLEYLKGNSQHTALVAKYVHGVKRMQNRQQVEKVLEYGHI